jgi:hypothetical protein
VAGLARAAYLRLPQSSASFGKTLALLAFAIPAVYAMATLGRSGVWGSEQALLDQALLHSPDSRRLRIDLAVRALETAKPQEAAVHVDYLWRTGTPTNHAIAGIWRVILACDGGGEVAPALLDDLARTPPKYIHVNAMAAFELLANRAESGRCPSLEAGALAAAMQAWLSASRQDAGNESIWRTRFNLARVLTAAGRFEEARTEALRAWTDGGHEFGVGVVLFRLAATLNRLDECRALLAELERNVHAGDRVQRSLLEQFKAYLESNPPTPAGTTGTVDTET